MSISSIFTLAIIAYTLYNKRDNKVLILLVALVFFELYANVGYFVSINGFEIQNSEVLWLALVTLIIRKKSALKMPVHRFAIESILVISIFVNILVNNIVNNTFSVQGVLVAIRFLFAIILFNEVGDNNIVNNIEFIKWLEKLQKISFVVLAAELIIKNVLKDNTWNQLVVKVFGSSINQVTWTMRRGGLFALQGLCKEPSHLAIALFIMSILDIIILEKRNTKQIMALNVCFLMISGSFSCLVYIAAICFAFVSVARGSLRKTILVGTAGVFLLMVFLFGGNIPIIAYYTSRLNRIPNIGNNAFSSEAVRLNSIQESFSSFLSSPIIGKGLGSSNSTGAIPVFLSTGGLLVASSYFMTMVKIKSIKQVIFYACLAMGMFFAMDIGIIYSATLIVINQFISENYRGGASS